MALDQKAKGIWDPETYTEQEYESTKPKQDMIPAWRRKLSMAAASPGRIGDLLSEKADNTPSSPQIDPGQAIGWSLTGTTNSPSSNLTFMYQNLNGEQPQQHPPPTPTQTGAGNMIYDPIRSSLPESSAGSTSTIAYPPASKYPSYEAQDYRQQSQSMAPPPPKYSQISSDPATTSDAEMLLTLQNSPYAHTSSSHHSFDASPAISSPNTRHDAPAGTYGYPNSSNAFPGPNSYLGLGGMGDMMMESQDIDMSTMGGDMMPWLEYLPQDVLHFFDGNGNNPSISDEGVVSMANMPPPSGR